MEILTAVLASPALSALIAIGGVILTLVVTNRHERNRLKATREDQLQNERIAPYRRVLAASATPPEAVAEMSELVLASSEAELVGGSSELIAQARHLRVACFATLARRKAHAEGHIKRAEVDRALEDWRKTRQAFLRLSREELDLDPAVVPELPGATFGE